MKKEHIDDVQPRTVDEHFKLLLEDKTILDYEMKDMTPDDLPDWYNENFFREGQNYYRRNFMAITMASFVGVLASISLPQTLKILVYTNKSSNPCVAFSRYIQTVLHIYNLHTCDPSDPDSNWYKTINVIRWKHNSSSKRAQNAKIGGIYQKDMAFTQFSFIGYILTMAETFGIRSTPEEEEAFVHMWRVIGYMLGIPDRLNICRKTAGDTRELCLKIINIFAHHLTEAPSSFYQIASTLLEALWNLNVSLNKDAVMAFTYRVHGSEYKQPLGWYSRLIVTYYDVTFYLFLVPYIGEVVRIYTNYMLIFGIWLVQKMPLYARLVYGKKHSQLIMYPKYK
ncbi:uncharacterized protein LOC105278583 [Ooceraea biroi]|uniref:ER-bound oxygenase mpaB/mpaB'/Rubber oxygenase catalytic domain-containing protein n=1 Tax=Ooceraea biroi TaxID=2015173 RepID=A0A026WKF5_OOCBI|nr:uncharacterized protein LOC105278583 [Ooceraea biroi]EZA56101.1 hypothetical protein X777_03582 [Ooceraea biroi]